MTFFVLDVVYLIVKNIFYLKFYWCYLTPVFIIDASTKHTIGKKNNYTYSILFLFTINYLSFLEIIYYQTKNKCYS